MSVDYENMTYQVLADCKRSDKFDYASYWQAMFEAGIPLERLYGLTNNWVQVEDEVMYGIVYRKIPQPIMVPLDFSDYLDINLRWMVYTRTNEKCFIGEIDNIGNLKVMYSGHYEWITFEDLQEHFTRLDGSRFEKVAQ